MKMRQFNDYDYDNFCDADSPEGELPLINQASIKIIGEIQPFYPNRTDKERYVVKNPYAYLIICKNVIEIGIWDDAEDIQHVATYQQEVDFKLGKWIAETLPQDLSIHWIRQHFNPID